MASLSSNSNMVAAPGSDIKRLPIDADEWFLSYLPWAESFANKHGFLGHLKGTVSRPTVPVKLKNVETVEAVTLNMAIDKKFEDKLEKYKKGSDFAWHFIVSIVETTPLHFLVAKHYAKKTKAATEAWKEIVEFYETTGGADGSRYLRFMESIKWKDNDGNRKISTLEVKNKIDVYSQRLEQLPLPFKIVKTSMEKYFLFTSIIQNSGDPVMKEFLSNAPPKSDYDSLCIYLLEKLEAQLMLQSLTKPESKSSARQSNMLSETSESTLIQTGQYNNSSTRPISAMLAEGRRQLNYQRRDLNRLSRQSIRHSEGRNNNRNNNSNHSESNTHRFSNNNNDHFSQHNHSRNHSGFNPATYGGSNHNYNNNNNYRSHNTNNNSYGGRYHDSRIYSNRNQSYHRGGNYSRNPSGNSYHHHHHRGHFRNNSYIRPNYRPTHQSNNQPLLHASLAHHISPPSPPYYTPSSPMYNASPPPPPYYNSSFPAFHVSHPSPPYYNPPSFPGYNNFMPSENGLYANTILINSNLFSTANALLSSNNQLNRVGVIDSGASKTLVNDINSFNILNPDHTPINVADGNVIYTEGIGRIGCLDDIYFVPELKFNLISVSHLTSLGIVVTFYPDDVVAQNGKGMSVVIGYKHGNLYLTVPDFFNLNIF